MKIARALFPVVFLLLAACSPAAPDVSPTEPAASSAIEAELPTSTVPPATEVPLATQTPAATPTPDPHFPPEAIEYARRLVDEGKVPGIAIGLITPDGEFFFNYGASTWESEAPAPAITENTLFEIGSITKVFTSILLANAVEEGLVTLDTPSQDLAPEGISMPAYKNESITLRVIASQRSGLPRMPTNFNPKDTFNPYADYTADMMYEYLDGMKIFQEPGTRYEYSNLGFMLLGDLLEHVYGKPYEQLLKEIITGPLEMPDTTITLSEDQQARFAQAHNTRYPVHSWEFLLNGAGAIRSTTTDMLKFLAANLNPGDDQLGAAMQLIRADCYETGNSGIEVCLGIHTFHRYSKNMYQHDGETGGYHSFSAWVPDDGTAVIVLVNSNYNIDPLGLFLLDPQVPLPAID